MEFYNHKRPHSALGGKPPAVIYWLRKDGSQTDQQEQRVAKFTPETVQELGSSSTVKVRPRCLRKPEASVILVPQKNTQRANVILRFVDFKDF